MSEFHYCYFGKSEFERDPKCAFTGCKLGDKWICTNHAGEYGQRIAILESDLAARDATIKVLREALTPFVDYLNSIYSGFDDEHSIVPTNDRVKGITMRHLRIARAALAAEV